MTNEERDALLRDAERYLELTTVGWSKVKTYDPLKLASTNWGKARALIDRVQADLVAPPPPPPPPPPDPPAGIVIAPPVGPFTVKDGGMLQASGEFIRDVSGVTRQKLEFRNFTHYGLGLMAWPPLASTGRATIEDIITRNIGPNDGPPGTSEAGIWIGQLADVRRFECYNADWMGLWTGSMCAGSLIEDFQLLDMPHVGAYLEHNSTNLTIRRGRIVAAHTGVNVEWTYGGSGSHHTLLEDLDIYCPVGSHWTHGGMFLDAGTHAFTIRRCRFWGPGKAIQLPNKRAGTGEPNVVEDCVFENQGSRVTYHDNPIG